MQDRETAKVPNLMTALKKSLEPYAAPPQEPTGASPSRLTDWIPTAGCDCEKCTAQREAEPPTGASPQAETSANVRALTVHICDDCLNLRGEMCNEPGCRFCRRTMAEVAEYLDALLIRPRIDGVSVLIDEGTPLPSPVSPVEPTPPTLECCACGHLNTPQQATRLEGEWRSSGEYICLDSDACARRIAECSEPPVEPTPEPETCEWRREVGNEYFPLNHDDASGQNIEDLQVFAGCPYCLKPLRLVPSEETK